MTDYTTNPASFKDPAGFVFHHQGRVCRQVNTVYAENYQLLMQSGLYDELTTKHLLVPHTESGENITGHSNWYRTLFPEQLSFISYPYEWSFNMLKDAALITLRVNRIALKHGMILKDASSYNIQFRNGKPIFIDTLSFEKYDESKPWIAYRQFCEMFLFPLYIQHYIKADINKVLAVFPEGIPVAITEKLLPVRSYFNLGVWLHVRLQNSLKEKVASTGNKQFSNKKLIQLLQHLKESVKGLSLKGLATSTWSNYYEETILSKDYLAAKETTFRSYLDEINFKTALDLGANDGYFSKIMAEKANQVIAVDSDSQSINNLYNICRDSGITRILPLTINIANPSAGIGFNNTERKSFLQRAESDLVTALAVIHHLVFTLNIPLPLLASCFAGLTRSFLIIEFVPIEDEKVKQLLINKDAFHLPYNEDHFETIFTEHFNIRKKQLVPHSQRVLYVMQVK